MPLSDTAHRPTWHQESERQIPFSSLQKTPHAASIRPAFTAKGPIRLHCRQKVIERWGLPVSRERTPSKSHQTTLGAPYGGGTPSRLLPGQKNSRGGERNQVAKISCRIWQSSCQIFLTKSGQSLMNCVRFYEYYHTAADGGMPLPAGEDSGWDMMTLFV